MTDKPGFAHRFNDDHGPDNPELAAAFAWMRGRIDGNGAYARDLACLRSESATVAFQLHLRLELTARAEAHSRHPATPPAGIPETFEDARARALKTWARAPARSDAFADAARADQLAAWNTIGDSHDFAHDTDGFAHVEAHAACAGAGCPDCGHKGALETRYELIVTATRRDALVFPTDEAPEAFRATFARLPVREIPNRHATTQFAGVRAEADAIVLVFQAEAFYGELDTAVRRPGLPDIRFDLRLSGRERIPETVPPVLDSLLTGVRDNLAAGHLRGRHRVPVVRDLSRRSRADTLDAWDGLVSAGFLEELAHALARGRRLRRRGRAGLAAVLAGLAGAPLAVAFAPAGPADGHGLLAAAGGTAAAAGTLAGLASRRWRTALEGLTLALAAGALPALLLTYLAPAVPETPRGRLQALVAVAAGNTDPEPFEITHPDGQNPDQRLRHYLHALALTGPAPDDAAVEAALARLADRLPASTRRHLSRHPARVVEAVARDRVALDLPDRPLFGPALPEAARLRLGPADSEQARLALLDALDAPQGRASWRNGPHAGAIEILARRTAQGADCVRFAQTLTLSGRTTEPVVQTACRADGTWSRAPARGAR